MDVVAWAKLWWNKLAARGVTEVEYLDVIFEVERVESRGIQGPKGAGLKALMVQ